MERIEANKRLLTEYVHYDILSFRMKKILIFIYLLYSTSLSADYDASCIKENTEILKRAKRVANKGNIEAQYRLGNSYHNGSNYKNAFYWYKKAANKGHAETQYRLGNLYFYGKGVVKNYKKAFYWYNRAANQGDRDAILRLAYIYSGELGNGKVVAIDLEKAYRYCLLYKTCDTSNSLENKLTPIQIKKIQDIANTFKPKIELKNKSKSKWKWMDLRNCVVLDDEESI